MKKVRLMVLGFLLSAGVLIGDEFYRPVYGNWTNLSTTWTNAISDPVIVRNIMLRAGLSNQTFTVEMIKLSGLYSNKIVAATTPGPTTNTAPINIFAVMELGDSLQFNSSLIETNAAGTNKYTIILQLNK